MNIEIIPATESDRAFFRKAHHLAYRDVIESMFSWDEEEQDKFANKDFDERNPHIIIYGKIRVGVLGWLAKADHIWFGPIYILPEHQNKGIGSYLVREFMNRARNAGLPLHLQTLRKNEKARKFYEKLGFTILPSDEIHWQMEYKSK